MTTAQIEFTTGTEYENGYLEVTLLIGYGMTYETPDNGPTQWLVEWWNVEEVDGEKLTDEQQKEWNRLMQDEAEDIENKILEEEA